MGPTLGMTMRLRARHYATGQPVEVVADGGRITSVGPPSDGRIDLSADWVAPSFFDLQVNGAHGVSFNSERLSADEVRRVAGIVRSHGAGGFCPTLITADAAALAHGFATLARACDDDAA